MVRFPRAAHARVPLATIAIVALLVGCTPRPDEAAPSTVNGPAPVVQAVTVARASAGTADDRVNKVVAISIDGLNPKMIRELGRSGAPNFYRMMSEGTGTLNARTEYEQTRTLPNHTGMLTGRGVDRLTGGHGWTHNTDDGSTVHGAAGHYVSSAFDVVHDHGGSTALFTAKAKFALFARTWNRDGAVDRIGRDNGRAKIDRFVVDESNARLVTQVIADLRATPRAFTFVHISLPDEAGHAQTFMGIHYRAAVRETDRLLGQILTTIAGRSTLRGQTMVILTADHGGQGATHSNAAELANYRVPFLAWGPGAGVAIGRNVYSLSPTYASPGSTRTTYRGKQPVRNGDLANLATDVLDLPRVPGAQFDSQRKLNVFR